MKEQLLYRNPISQKDHKKDFKLEQLLSCIQETPHNGIWRKLVWSEDRELFNEATVDSVDRSLMVILETMIRLGKIPQNIELLRSRDGVYFRLYNEKTGAINQYPLTKAEQVSLQIV